MFSELDAMNAQKIGIHIDQLCVIFISTDWFIKKWLFGINFSKKANQHEELYPKDVFVAKWLSNQKTFLDWTVLDEYPKRRIYQFEASPSHIYTANLSTLVYDKSKTGFELAKRFVIMKTVSSYEEEFYFGKALMNSSINFRRFEEGTYEFDCLFCGKWHRVILLYDLMTEDEVK